MKIAIVKLSAMGDIIHAMVALQYMKKNSPTLEIDWIVEKAFVQVLENNPHIDNILTVNLKAIKKDKLALFQEIKKIKSYTNNNYDLVIDAQGLLKSAITAKLLGKNVAGFSKNSIREGVASYFYQYKVEIPYERNAIERNVKVLSEPLHLSITPEDILNKQSFLFYNPKEKLPLELNDYIIFVVGASVENKIYPKEKFLEIAKGLEENIVVIWANTYEEEVALFLEKNTDNITVSPKLNLNQLKQLIGHSKLVIGGDTGPTHMAWALNIPSITIFGNTPEYRNTYITPINKVVKSNSYVDPLNLDKNDFSIQEIASEKITTLAKELIHA
jgi:heptosyltransferase-1